MASVLKKFLKGSADTEFLCSDRPVVVAINPETCDKSCRESLDRIALEIENETGIPVRFEQLRTSDAIELGKKGYDPKTSYFFLFGDVIGTSRDSIDTVIRKILEVKVKKLEAKEKGLCR